MSTDNLLPVSEAESVIRLNKAGYRTVFDIVNKSRAHFIKTVPDMDAAHAREIYRQAREHSETLKSLFRSWQLRQEPVIGGLKKLAASPSSLLKETLLRDLGGDGDFSDLLARSAEYADAASTIHSNKSASRSRSATVLAGCCRRRFGKRRVMPGKGEKTAA